MSKANNKHSDQKSSPSSNSDVNNDPSHNGELLIHPESRTLDPRFAMLQPYAPVSSSPDFKAVLNALRRRWFPALFLGLIFGFGGGLVAWFLVPAPYTAYRELFIKSVPERILFPTAEPDTKFVIYKNTQMRYVKSPFVLAEALGKPELKGLSLIQKVEKTMRPRVWLEKELEVTSPAEEFIRISLSGDEPEGLAEIVNAVTDSYFKEIVDVENSKRNTRLIELKNILEKHNKQLSISRKKLEDLANFLTTTNHDTISLKQQMNIEYYGELRRQLIGVRINLSMASGQLPEQDAASEQSVQETDSRKTDSVDELLIHNKSLIERQIEQRPEFIEDEQKIERLEELIAVYEQRHADDYPRLVDLKNKVKTRKTDLEKLRKDLRVVVVEELRKQVEEQRGISDFALRQKVETLKVLKISLEDELEKFKEREQKTGQSSMQLEYLQKEIALEEKFFDKIFDEMNRLEIELNAKERIDKGFPAEKPVERDSRKKYMITAFSGIGMFSLCFAGIVWIELRRGRISGIEEVAGALNLRVMGSLPYIPRSALNGTGRRRRSRNQDWQKRLSDSIDSTRTMLLREADRESLKLVMITSALPSEGKTTLSSHLATSLVRAGRKVLLIDCDLRWPGIHSIFDHPLSPGLCERLQGEADLDEVIYPASQEGLWIMPAGVVNEKVHKILAQGGIENVFQQVKQEFDFVVVDSSPVLPVTDSLMIAQHADAVMFSIRRDVSQGAKVAAAMGRMERLGVSVLGSVVIGLEKEVYGAAYPYSSGSTFR